MEANKFYFINNEELNKQWERIFFILDNIEDNESFLLMILINKALEETFGRRIDRDDFFHENNLLEALKLLEHWLDEKSYFLGKVH